MTAGMIRVRRRMTDLGELWFDEEPTGPLPDVLFLRQRYERPATGSSSTQRSLVVDLTAAEDRLWNGLGNTCRYKIRRARERDRCVCTFHDRPDDNLIAEFAGFHAAFARQKGLPPIGIDKLIATARVGRLCLSTASFEGETIVWHSYVLTGKVARLADTASLFRSDDAERRAVIGRANRLLHWHDIVAFREAGFEKYDWGGLFIDESKPDNRNINSFKREFGGEERDFFRGIQGISLQGKLYVLAHRLFNRGS